MKRNTEGRLYSTQTIKMSNVAKDANQKITKTVKHRHPENEHSTVILTEKELRLYRESVNKMKPGKTIQAI